MNTTPSCSTRYSNRACFSRRAFVVVRAADINCRDAVGERREVESQGKVFKLKFLAAGGATREADCPDNMYILDAAEKAGIDLPATCRGEYLCDPGPCHSMHAGMGAWPCITSMGWVAARGFVHCDHYGNGISVLKCHGVPCFLRNHSQTISGGFSPLTFRRDLRCLCGQGLQGKL